MERWLSEAEEARREINKGGVVARVLSEMRVVAGEELG